VRPLPVVMLAPENWMVFGLMTATMIRKTETPPMNTPCPTSADVHEAEALVKMFVPVVVAPSLPLDLTEAEDPPLVSLPVLRTYQVLAGVGWTLRIALGK
jgi:hypothetical protein